ncbi:hypothetical protein MRB53_034488 [Persea americana]|uniref:Uncharacterized protein n=1 Tax=Persea americana TaxID=3435 RepID=A0ACC2K1W6_PERAE|nr:hypothetical protein MRB53_034488 [Persea americana]
MASTSETHHLTISSSSKSPHEFPLTRQSSIYSLTLDEFQHSICEPGKTFGSMNMDEFLANIWNAEGSQAVAAAMHDAALSKHYHPQLPLPRQSSLTIPPPLCSKTVEEVWSEIHKEQQQIAEGGNARNAIHANAGNATRQTTFGEMTLEDFLIKAGVVRESCGPSAAAAPSSSHFRPPPHHQQQQQYGYGGFGYGEHRKTASRAMGGGIPACPAYPSQGQQQVGGVVGDRGGFPGVFCGGFGGAQTVSSPVSSDGVGQNQVVEMRGGGGRRRVVGGHPEKGVERRQRRMIKNRESAARSRARKQAYTVELEAELEMLKEENARLRKEREEEEVRRRKKGNPSAVQMGRMLDLNHLLMIQNLRMALWKLDCLLEAMMAIIEVPSTKEKKYKTLRRTFTGPW